jgi:hypothetical protein
MKMLRKAIAYFAIYNAVSILFIGMAISLHDKGINIDYSGLVYGAYIGVAVVFVFTAITSLALYELMK